MKLCHTFAALLAVACVLFPARLLPAAETTAALVDRLPADAVLAVVSGDVGATWSAFQKTSLGTALCGEAFRRGVPVRQARPGKHVRLRPLFGFDWSELARVTDPGGIVAFPLPTVRSAPPGCLSRGNRLR